jgi:DNA-directed RNA polymerase subunit RPC12/RpoP
MSEVKDLFRICPTCGRRFHIKLISKKLVDDRKDVEEIKQAMISPMPMGYTRGSMPTSPIIVEENIPVTIEIEDFQYSYKCKHCGHEWTENHAEERKAG